MHFWINANERSLLGLFATHAACVFCNNARLASKRRMLYNCTYIYIIYTFT